MFVEDIFFLRQKCEPTKSRRESGIIIRRLTEALLKHNKRVSRLEDGVSLFCLAAPQIGIYRQVGVYLDNDVPTPIVNPAILKHCDVKLLWAERDPCFPGRKFNTYRWPWVNVKAEGRGLPLMLGPRQPDEWWERTSLEKSFFAQQMIAHLNGLIPRDFTSEEYPEPWLWPTWEGVQPDGQKCVHLFNSQAGRRQSPGRIHSPL